MRGTFIIRDCNTFAFNFTLAFSFCFDFPCNNSNQNQIKYTVGSNVDVIRKKEKDQRLEDTEENMKQI